MSKARKNELKIARKGKTARLTVSGVMGWDYWGTTAGDFRKEYQEKAAGAQTIEVEIDTPGGVITDGRVMINILDDSDAVIHTYVTGEAASMGSSLLMAGDKMFIPSNATVMIHKPLSGAGGNADDLRHAAERLDVFEEALINDYMRHFKGSKDELKDLMKAETTFSAAQMEDKFHNVIIMRKELKAVACSEPILEFPTEEMDAVTILDKAGVSFGTKLLAFLKGEGFAQATEEPGAGNSANQETMEEEMTPEDKAALAKEVQEGVMAMLKEAGVIQAKKDEQQAVEVEFVGCKTDPDDVQAHLEKVQFAQLEASTDFNDPKSVKALYDALTPKVSSTALPSGNVADPDTSSTKEQNRKDTEAFVNNLIK